MNQDMKELEMLSDAARRVLEAGPPDAYARLFVAHAPEDNAERIELRRQLATLTPQTVLTRHPTSLDDANALLAGLWLWHDFLDESHHISQSLQNATGSFWHAIMHRREGDFSNAKYWYARCRNHPALVEIKASVSDPAGFVDQVERVSERQPGEPAYDAAVRLQRLEWTALFRHCVRTAAGR